MRTGATAKRAGPRRRRGRPAGRSMLTHVAIAVTAQSAASWTGRRDVRGRPGFRRARHGAGRARPWQRGGGAEITFIAPVHQGDVLVAAASERIRFGRSGSYDVTVPGR